MSGLESHLPALRVVAPLFFAPVLVMLAGRGIAWAAATLVSAYATFNAISLAAGAQKYPEPIDGGYSKSFGRAHA